MCGTNEESTKLKSNYSSTSTSPDHELTNESPISLCNEIYSLLHIALPTVAVQFCTFLLFPMTASVIGRNFEPEYLAGFSLASLSGNITCISIIIGSLSACETLQPRSYGLKKYKEVGLIAVRGFFFCALVLTLPIIILYHNLYPILIFLGQDPLAASLASSWVKIYLCGIPPVLLFRIIQRFLSCQNIVMPCAYSASLGLFILPLLLKFIVGYGGSALALISTQWLQLLVTLIILKNSTGSYNEETWPGLNYDYLKEALSWEEMKAYGELGVGGVLSLSEWWFWEVICFIAGKFGVVPLCAHSIAYQLLPLSFMLPLGISMGLSVRLGNLLPQNVNKAKKLAMCTMAFTVILALPVCIGIYHFQPWIISMFTTDTKVITTCNRIWGKVCIDIFFLYVLGVNGGILRALGMQWKMAITVFGCLWCIALPVIIKISVYQGGGLDSLWTLIPCTYFLLNVCLSYCYVTADWNSISNTIRQKAEETKNSAKYDIADECTSLLV